MVTQKNFYQILGVRQNASQSDIDSAYTELQAKYQLLYDQGDQDASLVLFNIKGAYEILSTPKKREAYDDKLAGLMFQTVSNPVISEKKPQPGKLKIGNVKPLLYIIALAVLGVISYSSWTYIKQNNENKMVKETTQVVLRQLEQFQTLIQVEWDPAFKLAASTSRIALATPVQRMQDIRSKTNNQPADGCVANVKRNLLDHMDLSIEAFLEFMRDNENASDELLYKAKDKRGFALNHLNICNQQSQSTINKLDQ